MNPNDPWGKLPLATVGDADIDTLYASVGRSLTQWEVLEANLALLFAYIVKPKGGSEEARRAYGSIATFRGRISMLEAAAAVHFAHTGTCSERQYIRPILRVTDWQIILRDEAAAMTYIDRYTGEYKSSFIGDGQNWLEHGPCKVKPFTGKF